MSMDRTTLQRAVRAACYLDVQALKPGNVSVDSPGSGMTAADFFASADAIAAPITAPYLSIGERIYRAVEATQTAVNCNTNLGIVLLVAPLIQAQFVASDFASLRSELTLALENLTIEDARWAYRAIDLAKPGGMGESAKHDLRQTPQVTFYDAMREAVDRDQIAQLYVTGYRRLFDRALPAWREAMARWGSQTWATTAVFLTLLGDELDSLIIRKFGGARAEHVSAQAKAHLFALNMACDPTILRKNLLAWDERLKADHLNPGTTADMTVATAFLAHLQDMY